MWKSTQNLYDYLDHHAQGMTAKPIRNFNEFRVRIRALLILWFFTTLIMWFYVLYCMLAFPLNSPLPWIGLIFTLLHTSTPWLFKHTQCFKVAGLNISLTGLGFQTCFCLFTGGVYSPAAIWLAVHPVILAFFGTIEVICFSVALNSLIIILMYVAGLYNLLPQNNLPQNFKDTMLLSSYIGLDFLIAIFTIMAIKINLKKNQELNKSKELSECLVRILCHDINNPLSIIQIAGKQLSKNQTSSSIFTDKIIRAGNDIHQITHSVSFWISHNDGKLYLKKEIISIKEIIDHLEFSFEDRLIEKKLSMRIMQNCIDHTIIGDKTALYFQVFNNLISNAIKFSYEGSRIEVTFSCQDSLINIEVRDYGVGIKDELIDQVFSLYSMTSTPGTKNEKGTGWGLPIAATVVEKMNGTIEIANMKNISDELGTRVNLTFPKFS